MTRVAPATCGQRAAAPRFSVGVFPLPRKQSRTRVATTIAANCGQQSPHLPAKAAEAVPPAETLGRERDLAAVPTGIGGVPICRLLMIIGSLGPAPRLPSKRGLLAFAANQKGDAASGRLACPRRSFPAA